GPIMPSPDALSSGTAHDAQSANEPPPDLASTGTAHVGMTRLAEAPGLAEAEAAPAAGAQEAEAAPSATARPDGLLAGAPSPATSSAPAPLQAHAPERLREAYPLLPRWMAPDRTTSGSEAGDAACTSMPPTWPEAPPAGGAPLPKTPSNVVPVRITP